MGGATLAVKALQTTLYGLIFCASAAILAIYSYFLAIEHNHGVNYPNRQRATEGISGAGVLYSIFAIILTCFLGGITFFAFLGVVLDILFVGGFIAIAVFTDDGVHSCNNQFLNTPIGYGRGGDHLAPDGNTYSISLRTACKMNKAVFIISIIGAFFFALAALIQLWLSRAHNKDKRFGPSPANNYTSGSGRRRGFFGRRRNRGVATGAAAEPGVVETNGFGHDNRLSHGTATTDSYAGNKYEAPVDAPVNGGAGGYHTGPAGTGVNPYGYENERSHAV